VKVLVAVPDVRGGTDSVFEVTGTAGGVVAERAQGSKSWRLLLANAGSVLEVMGGTAESVPEGMLVTAAAGSHRIEIRLSG
jgi:hypothetical protein